MHIKKNSPSLSETTLRIGATMALPAVLRQLGEDPELLLVEAGFDISLFDNPDNRISYVARGNLLEYCAAKTGCNHLGLLIGQHAGLSSLGLVGMLVKYSPNVVNALDCLSRFMHLHVQGAAVTLESHGNLVSLGYAAYQPDTKAVDLVGDGAIAVIFNIMQELCGTGWRPYEIRFTRQKPDDTNLYRRFFKAPLIFDSTQNAVVFDANWLNHSISSCDDELRRLLQIQIAQIEAQYSDAFPEQVRSVLRTAIIANHASANQIATLFSMHSRTLNRRLHEFDTNFQSILDECHFEIARQMLENSKVSVSKVAYTLNFAEESSFTRSFKRWSGKTPAQWRMLHGKQNTLSSEAIGRGVRIPPRPAKF